MLSDVLQILCHALQLSINVFSQFVAAEHTGTKIRVVKENSEDLLAVTATVGNQKELPHLQPRAAETWEEHPGRLQTHMKRLPTPVSLDLQTSRRVEDFLQGFVGTEGRSKPGFRIPYLFNQTNTAFNYPATMHH